MMPMNTLADRIDGPIFICTGEPSGDLYAHLLIRQIQHHKQNADIVGVGGEELARSGIRLIRDHKGMQAFGLSVSSRTMVDNYRAFRSVARILYRIRPRTFIAVSYPGVNLLLCRYAKRIGCHVLYFLPPQIWAWGGFRKYFIRKWVDEVVSIFPFEYEFYRREKIHTRYLENPLTVLLRRYQRTDHTKRVGLMPGSRMSEVKRNLPILIEVARNIRQRHHDIELDMILYPPCPSGIHLTDEIPTDIRLVTENRHQAMKNCDMLLLCSGTASLEAAMMDIPQVFCNRPALIDYHVFRHMLKIREYNLANLYFDDQRVATCVSRNRQELVAHLLNNIERTCGI